MTTSSGSQQSVEIDGLDPISTYLVQVSAWTSAGEGERSNTIAPTTGQGIPRTPPDNVNANALNKTAIKVLWWCVCECVCMLILLSAPTTSLANNTTAWLTHPLPSHAHQVTYELPPSDEGEVIAYSIYFMPGALAHDRCDEDEC